ncbi:MAG: ABC transporter ATP-binding protein [Verrucomicrobiota bacterium]
MSEPILEISDLVTAFDTDDGRVTAVDSVSFDVPKGKTLGLVGESGCGKSVTALSIIRLLPRPMGQVLSGQVLLEGRNLLEVDREEMYKIRGNEIGMIFQEPMTALNPVHKVGKQLNEVYFLHQQLGKKEARERSIEMLDKVRIPSPEIRIDEYPHQLSGGMRQRVMIAMALACHPRLLIADEPTTALDVTVQAQILDLMAQLQEEMGMSVILITHDLGVIAESCDEVVVMYAGRVVEKAPVKALFANPLHAYTRGLLGSIPKLDTPRKSRLPTIEGMVPSLWNMPEGCRFAPRCPGEHPPELAGKRPEFIEIEPDHWVEACPVCVPTLSANAAV